MIQLTEECFLTANCLTGIRNRYKQRNYRTPNSPYLLEVTTEGHKYLLWFKTSEEAQEKQAQLWEYLA